MMATPFEVPLSIVSLFFSLYAEVRWVWSAWQMISDISLEPRSAAVRFRSGGISAVAWHC